MVGEAEDFDTAVSDVEKVQALLEFVAWCALEGNQAGTFAGKNSARLHFHRVKTGGVARVLAAH